MRASALIATLAVSLPLMAWPTRGGADVPTLKKPPNIVVFAMDTTRADHLSCYGYPRNTSPNIDRLASEGVLFERCYSAGSWTLPSFTSLFTGVVPMVHGLTNSENVLSSKLPTLGEKFHERGYFAAGIASNPFLFAKYGFGRGFEKYDDYSVFLDAELADLAGGGNHKGAVHRECVTGESAARQAKRMIAAGKKSGKPILLFLHFFDPHDSYVPPRPFRKWVDGSYKGSVDGHVPGSMRDAPPAGPDLDQLRALYDGEIAYDDDVIGKLVQELETNFDPADTLIIFLGDHGEAFGEHGMLLHGNSVYREEVSVPMIWRWPGVLPKNHRVKTPVSLLDVSASLRDVMHFEGLSHLQGQSLWSGLSGGEVQPRDLFSEKANDLIKAMPRHIAMTRGNLRLHARFPRAFDGSNEVKYELYDLTNDPWEKVNLAELQPELLATLRPALIAHTSQSQSLHATYAPESSITRIQLDEKERRRLEGLGYTQSPKPKQ